MEHVHEWFPHQYGRVASPLLDAGAQLGFPDDISPNCQFDLSLLKFKIQRDIVWKISSR